ncbi:dihydrodipicolinate synthase [Aureobasidium sp. EXF-10727]|nr:dihydrodipicolinate synthase [Aureobasidium sp. EXF-10727]
MPSSTRDSAIPGGVWCPVVSLYRNTPRQEVDLEASRKYFAFLIQGGVSGLVLQGSTAEAALLMPSERVDLIKTARQAAADVGKPNFPLMVGITGQSTNETLQLVDDAAKNGADFGLLLPPSYWPKAVTNDVIVDFYEEVADNSQIPIVVYNFPGVTSGIDLGVDVLSRLAKHPNIVGVKLTCANAGKVATLTAQYTPDQFAVFSGQSDWLLPCLISGGMGCVTGIGNVFPRSVVKLYSLWQEGKMDQARQLQGQVAQAESACKKGLAATKYGTAYFAGPAAGLSDQSLFLPRKPYKLASKDLQGSTISTMQVLADLEASLIKK